jgi:hypothetical protein
MTINQSGAIGLNKVLYSFKDNNGINIGSSPTLAEGADSDIGMFFASQELAMSIPSLNVVNLQGDDGTRGAIGFEGDGSPQGNLTVNSYDVQLSADMEGLTANDETDFAKYGLIGAENKTPKNMSLMTQSQTVIHDENLRGTIGWEYINWLAVQGQNLGRATYAFQGVGGYNYFLFANRGSRWIWNESVASEDVGDTAGYNTSPITFTERLRVHYFRDDETVVQFTLAYKPSSKDQVSAYRTTADGTTSALTQSDTPADETEFDVNISTGVFDLGGSGTAGDVVTVRYNYESIDDATS